LGLANAMKRLQLLYAGDFELAIDDTNGIYSVMLQLKAK
jgi:sensor histidine kinase YesM